MSRPTPAAPDATTAMQGLIGAGGGQVLRMAGADVGGTREVRRRRRWVKLTALVWGLVAVLWTRALLSDGGSFVPLPHVDPFLLTIIIFFGLLMGLAVGQQALTGRSPHTMYRADQIDTRLADVVGIDGVKDEVVRSLNLFLAHKTFADDMGGRPRRGLLFEGAPGTGKTHLARAMAAEAGVPFLFASGTSFQTVWQGQSSKKIRSFFKALNKAARKEGGAIAFIEEIDVIALARGGVTTASNPQPSPMSGLPGGQVGCCSGTAGLPGAMLSQAGAATVSTPFTGGGDNATIINELLVQMQSFDSVTGWHRVGGWFLDKVNLYRAPDKQLSRRRVDPPNVLIIAATNRADALDPALLRPGRFDRRLSFELPTKSGRRQLIDHFLARKAHDPELDQDERRDALAAITQGYTPVMIEQLCDEALVNAVRRGERAMRWEDLEHARLSIEVGTGQPVDYTDHERALIATHEAGHATAAWLCAPERRLEILTIIKRRGALGLLAHGDREDVFTRSRTELQNLIKIALAGQCAEEIFFGDVSTGPGGDLLYATNAAAEMVGAHGMEGSLVSYLAVSNSAFSDTNIVGRVLADDRGRDAVEALLQGHKRDVKALLQANRHLVEALRDALVERHELVGHEITDVLEAAAAAPRTVDLTSGDRARQS